MKYENIREYELIRQEMTTVKECITRYLGFVLGGTGVAVYAILAMSHTGTRFCEVAFISFVFSVIMSFVSLVLFYKFYSHNRFAGYCKLLNQEILGSSLDGKDICLLSWEVCVERLRALDCSPKIARDSIGRVEIKNISEKAEFGSLLNQYTGKDPVADTNKFFKGLRILFAAMVGSIETRSWGFPPIIVAMLFCIVVGFLVGGIWAVLSIPETSNTLWSTRKVMVVLGSLVLIAQLILWWRFTGKLYSLMKGSATVDAFFWRFLPVRAEFLNGHGIVPEYVHADKQLEQAIAEVDAQKTKRGDDG